MQTEEQIRSWEHVRFGWVLCCTFGDRAGGDAGRVRPLLRRRHDGAGWVIQWCEQHGADSWCFADGQDIAETYDDMTTEEAMCWALAEIAAVAHARSLEYAKQHRALMLELLRIRGQA